MEGYELYEKVKASTVSTVSLFYRHNKKHRLQGPDFQIIFRGG